MKKWSIVLACLAAVLCAPVCFALTTSLSSGGESVVVDWPDAEGWVVGYQQDVGDSAILETVKKPETVQNWTELGTLLIERNPDALFVNLDWLVEKQVETSRQRAKEVEYEAIWSGIKDGYDMRIYLTKCRDYPDGTSEMQVWLLIKTKKAIHYVSWIKRARDVDKATVEKWAEFLKTVKVTEETEPQAAPSTK